MDSLLFALLGLLLLLQFMLPGIVFSFTVAWVERRNEVRGIRVADKVASVNQVASVALLTFLGTAGAAAIIAPYMADLSDLYSYIYASIVGMMAFGGFARWLMSRIIRARESAADTE